MITNSLLIDGDDDDPMHSVVNLIDVFLVIIAALLLSVANNPLSPLGAEQLTVIREAGTPEMEVVVKNGNEIKRFRADGQQGIGGGVRVGSAYRLPDGSMIYIPEEPATIFPVSAE